MESADETPDELRAISLLLAHDLRNVLSVMNNLVILMEHRTEARHLSMLKAQIELCEQTVEHFVQYAREGTLRKPAHLSSLVRQAAAMASFPPHLDVEIRAEFEGEVIVDAQQIRQVILNLLRNAATACSGGPGRIRVVVSAEPGFARVDVEDSGPGVPESLQADLLQRPVSPQAGGLGLGLNLCRRIVEAGGGRMNFDTSGSGSRFSVWLPREAGP